MQTLTAATTQQFAYEGFTITRLTDDSIADITALHTTVYGKKPPRDFYYRKYNTGFAGKKYLGYIAYNVRNKPVAFYGVVPCFVATNGKLVGAAQCADTIEDASACLPGLFTKMGSLVEALCKEEDITFLFALPSQQYLQAMVGTLGWQQHGYVDSFAIPVNAIPFKGFMGTLGFINGLYKMLERKVIAQYGLPEQGVANSIVADGFGGIFRDSNYLNYKSFRRNLVVRAGQSKVWVALGHAIMVGDISLQGDIEEVVQVLKKLAQRLGVNNIKFLTSPGTSLHNRLSAKYAPSQALPVVFQTMGNCVDTANIKFVLADLDIF